MSARRSFWSLSRREVRGQAVVLAGVLWVGAAALLFGTRGDLDLLGRLKGPDFVHFYTVGTTVWLGETGRLYDRSGLHELQTELVPDSSSEMFQPVYGPQTALLFAAVAWMPYQTSMLVWALLTAVVYAASIRTAWRRWRHVLEDRTFVFVAAAGFPPFWNLMLHGQTTAVPMLAFLGGWLALERDRRLLAGLVLGCLAIKPQLGLVLAVVVLVCGEWAMLAGAILSVALQAGLVAIWLGPDVLAAYANTLRALPSLAPLLEPRPYQLHSMAAVTRLVPGIGGTIVWAVLAGAVSWLAVRGWRTSEPLSVRVAVLMVATVLVSPHLTIYDASLLAMPLVLLGGWAEARGESLLRAVFRVVTYLLFVAFLVPVALLIRLQPSVFLLVWLFLVVVRSMEGQPEPLASSRYH